MLGIGRVSWVKMRGILEDGIRLRVGESEIRRGRGRDYSGCPVSITLREGLGGIVEVRTGLGKVEIYENVMRGSSRWVMSLSEGISRWIMEYDDGLWVEPFTMRVKLGRGVGRLRDLGWGEVIYDGGIY